MVELSELAPKIGKPREIIVLHRRVPDKVHLGSIPKDVTPINLSTRSIGLKDPVAIRLSTKMSVLPLWVEDEGALKTSPTMNNIKLWSKNPTPGPIPEQIILQSPPGKMGAIPGDVMGGWNTGDDLHKILCTNISDDMSQASSINMGSDKAYQAIYTVTGKKIIITSDEVIHLCFSTHDGTRVAVYHAYSEYSQRGEISWTVEKIDSAASVAAASVSCVADKLDNVHFIWHHYVSGSDWRVRYRQKTKAGAWTAIEAVSTMPDMYYNADPVINVKPDGLTIGAVWTGGGYGSDITGYNVLHRERSSAGSWGSITALTTDAASGSKDYRWPSIDYDIDGYAHIAWTSYNNGTGKCENVYFRNCDSGGWNAIETVSSGAHADISGFPSNIVVDSDGNVFLAYLVYNAGSGYWDGNFKKRVGGAWGSAENFVNSSISVQIQLGYDGTVTIVMTGAYSGKYSTFYRQRYPDGSWGGLYLYAHDASNHIFYPQVLWSRLPTFFGTDRSISNQYNIDITVRQADITSTTGNLWFGPIECGAVMGSGRYNVVTKAIKVVNKGSINRKLVNPIGMPGGVS